MWFFDGLGGFIGEKFWLNTKIPIFWRFWPQNVTFYHPTLVMNCKKPLLFFTFTIVTYMLCSLWVIFWWFRKTHCGEMLIKYQKYQYFNDFRPKCDHLPPYPSYQMQKIIIFYLSNNFLYIVLPKGNFLMVWEDLLWRNVD